MYGFHREDDMCAIFRSRKLTEPAFNGRTSPPTLDDAYLKTHAHESVALQDHNLPARLRNTPAHPKYAFLTAGIHDQQQSGSCVVVGKYSRS